MGDEEICYSSMEALSGRIAKGEVSPVEVTEAFLRRIESLNSELFAYVTIAADRALEDAGKAEAEIMAGQWRGPMHGIPYGVKDIVDTAGVLTTNGSSFHRNNVPAEDAEIIHSRAVCLHSHRGSRSGGRFPLPRRLDTESNPHRPGHVTT